jgi:hypothetical protein
MSYLETQSMNGTVNQIIQPLAYRVWDPRHKSYFHTDVRPDNAAFLERWTGLFDKQGAAIYEGDILRVHHDWRYGWVRAVVVHDEKRGHYTAEATTSDGITLRIGFYSFADAYRVGNFREHPGKLVKATEQFHTAESEVWWLSPGIFPSVSRRCFN